MGVVEANVGVEDSEVGEDKVVGVEIIVEVSKIKAPLVLPPTPMDSLRTSLRTLIQDTKLNAILIPLHLKPVSVIGPLESQLIFVWSQGHALGRTSGPLSLTNETLTNPAFIKTTVNSIICYIVTDYQKYIQSLVNLIMKSLSLMIHSMLGRVLISRKKKCLTKM